MNGNKKNNLVNHQACAVPRKAIAAALAACFGSVAWANPTGGVVVHGAANFSNPAVNVLNINTLTPKTIINWGSFSISAGELTRILQPTALSAVLNRVTGGDPSSILGALQSNGRVFLLNPNGIVFGAGAQINVAGLVASTLNLSDADFLLGRMNFTNGIGAGSVVNQGSINAAGGPVYLVGNSVTNNGIITNPNGEVVLAAGNSVELVNPGTPNLRVEITAPENEARNLGTISADAGRIGIYAGLIRQGGTISADSAVAEGGRIILKSTRRTDLEAGSVTSARGSSSGGEILALSDMSSGTTTVAGTLDASATAGNGGFIETSAASVTVSDTALVTASGSVGAKAGKWLIDPNDFYIQAYGGGISGNALGVALDTGATGTDFEISTISTAGGVPGVGDIHVDDIVVWTKGSTLTLTAENNILFGLPSSIKLDGGTTGNVVLNAGGNIQTNAYGGYVDVKANSLTANAVTGIGVIGNFLQTEVANAVLTNTTSGNIQLRNYRALNVSASNPNGSINLSAGDTNQLIVGPGNTINAGGTLNLYASHVEIRGNTTAGGDISISAGAPASIIVDSGANLQSTSGDLHLSTNHFDFGGAGTVKGNNIYLQNFFGDFDIGVSPRTTNETITAASMAKLAVNTPASGIVEISSGSFGSNAIYVDEAMTFTTPNVQNLRLIGSGGIHQDPPGVITVANLHAQSSNGPVLLDAAVNSVGTLSGSARDQFRFRNSGNLTVGGSGISVTGNPGGMPTVEITVTAGNLTVAGPITATGASGSSVSAAGSAKVQLDASGNVQINSSISAYGGYGGSGGDGGDAEIKVTAGSVTINAGNSLQALGGAAGLPFTDKGQAKVELSAYGGNITQDGYVLASGGPTTSIELSALSSGGAIVQTNSSGLLEAVASGAYGGALIALKADSGIGSSAAPVRIKESDNNIFLQNNGTAGNIGVSFYGGSVNIDNMSDVYNNNPNGAYFIQAENGDINLTAPFVPDVPLSANQSVELKTLAGGNIIINSGAGAGIIIPGTGTGNVKLTALGGGSIDLAAGSVVAGTLPELTADHMDIQGQVLGLSGMVKVMPATPGRNIELGTSGPVVGALALDNTELNNMTAWDGVTIPVPGAAGGGLVIGDNVGGSGMLTFTGNVNSSAYLNVYGTSVGQTAGIITGGVSAHAGTGNVALTQPTNAISSVGGSTNGGSFTVNSTVSMYTGDITTNGGNVNIQTTGSSLLFDSLTNAGAGTVQLTSAGTIVDTHIGLDIQASAATLTAPGGIGTIADPIETQLASLAVSATGGTGEVGIINTGNLSLSSLGFSGTTAAIEATGILTQGSAINALGNVGLKGQAGLNLGFDINVGPTGNASLEAGAGADVVFSGSGGVNTSSGGISVTAGRDIIYGGSSTINSSSGNVVLTAGRDVFFNTQLINTLSGDVQISAGRDYVHNSTSKHNTSSGDVTIQSGGDLNFAAGGINSSSGVLLLQAGGAARLSGGAQVTSGTGSIGVEALGAPGVGVSLIGGTTKIQGASVAIVGTAGAAASSDNVGVLINGATVQATGGGVSITGTGGAGAISNDGVRVIGGGLVTANGTVYLEGYGANGTSDNTGVRVSSATVRSTGGGTVTLYGEGGAGSTDNHGIRLEGTALVTSAGTIDITGFGGGSTNENTGVKLAGGTIDATGTGGVVIYGEGGAGVSNNEGIRVESAGLIRAANGAISLTGFGAGSGTGNEGVDISGAVQTTGTGVITMAGTGAAGSDRILLQGSGSITSSSTMTFTSGFTWAGGTIGGTGLLVTPVGAQTNVTGLASLAPGKTWNNGGTVDITGSGTIGLGNSTAAVFNNLAGGVVNIASGAGWSFISNPSTQVGQINNAGTINVNQSTSWEAAFNQSSTGTLNIAPSQFVSMQNGQVITGAANIGAGGTLWVSERHGSDALFSNMGIGGTGTLQVAGSGPVAQFMNISAPGITLRLGSGGQIKVHNGAMVVGGLTLDSPAFGSAFSMTDAVLSQTSGNLTVPSNAVYAGDNSYVAQAGDLLVPGVVNGGAGALTLAAPAGDLKVNGGAVSADIVNLLGVNVAVGDSAASTPSSVTAGSAMNIAALGALKITGGSGSGASSLVSSSGVLLVDASGDVALAGGSGANAWAKLSGNPDVVLASVGGAVRLDAGSGTGSYAKIEAISPVTVYLNLTTAASGGYFVNGVEGVVYDPVTGTGFVAGGSPAILGTNLIVTYNGVALPPGSGLLDLIEDALEVPTQTLIVATNDSTKPPDAEKEKNIFSEEGKKDKKKEAPVCK